MPYLSRAALRALLTALFILLGASTASAEAPSFPFDPAPPSLSDVAPTARRTASDWMIRGGVVALSVGYSLSAVFGTFANMSIGWPPPDPDPRWDELRGWAFVPVIGPFAQLAVMPPSGEEGGWPEMLAVTGLVQAIGFGALIGGLVLRLTRPDEEEEPADEPSLAIAPSVTGTDFGLVASGRF